MQIRRCAIVLLEPRERLDFDLALVASGGQWFAFEAGVVCARAAARSRNCIDSGRGRTVGELSPTQWADCEELACAHPRAVLDSLLAKQLIVAQGSDAAARDDKLRDAHWRGHAAVQHYSSRWSGIDTEEIQKDLAESGDGDLLAKLDAAPALVRERAPAGERSRCRMRSCRRSMSCSASASPVAISILRGHSRASSSRPCCSARGARAPCRTLRPKCRCSRKGCPPRWPARHRMLFTLQRVDGIAPGLYHYHPVDHALEPMQMLRADEAGRNGASVRRGTAIFRRRSRDGNRREPLPPQLLEVRNHAKAYRALILDVGHVSQAQYLGRNRTGSRRVSSPAAINEVDIEQAFGLDPIEKVHSQSPVSACALPNNARWSGIHCTPSGRDSERCMRGVGLSGFSHPERTP